MHLREFFRADSGVSNVIGVTVLVAITLILATVVGAYAFDLGGTSSESPPQASFEVTFPNSTYAAGEGGDVVRIVHNSGNGVDARNLDVTVGDTRFTELATDGGGVAEPFPRDVGPGATLQLRDGGGNGDFAPGEEVRIIWESSDGESTATLGTGTVPEP
ncbi:type IV pilin N-terminal domain-containing protein [Halosegnis marinus]|uniref:Type IV pilin N-terminal domain-containing protein n=1 Tax=Halosegnis marinus TaxID=3034023 RepID=A0ABD5ZQ03_9EURY|nr:type IV pilin N-terminal domain-containing protein [Halosegnis sp. DT85]